jgi:hypothetical protein
MRSVTHSGLMSDLWKSAEPLAFFSQRCESPPVQRLASSCLVDGGRKGVMNAKVVPCAGHYAEPGINIIDILACQLINARDAEQLEIGQHGFADIAQLTQFLGWPGLRSYAGS